LQQFDSLQHPMLVLPLIGLDAAAALQVLEVM
jgi:hypothetical protein